MIIEDRGLRKLAAAGAVTPYDPALVNPASIDLRLGTSFRVQRTHTIGQIDLADVPPADEISELIEIGLYRFDIKYDSVDSKLPPVRETRFNDEAKFIIHPGEFVLCSTLEYLRIPHDVAMAIDGKSSVGRLGLTAHVTAGFFDPGFEGIGTLEMVNLSPVPIILRPGLPICQSRWMRMESVPAEVYNGRYQGDRTVSGSRYGQER